jgi:hypothetical protein
MAKDDIFIALVLHSVHSVVNRFLTKQQCNGYGRQQETKQSSLHNALLTRANVLSQKRILCKMTQFI